VLTRLAVTSLPSAAVGALSVPSAALLFVLAAPWFLETADFNWPGLAVFAGIGLLFPAAVTLLIFESTRRVGSTLTGTVGGLTPLFAIAAAVLFLGEALRPGVLAGALVIFAGIALLMGAGPPGGMRLRGPLVLPVAAAAIRGGAQTASKLGLALWAAPYAAVMIGYCVSALVMRTGVMLGYIPRPGPVGWRLRALFAAIGVMNGFAVLAMYTALAHAPVAIVSCIVATYPVFTLLIGAFVARIERWSARSAVGVAVSVIGVGLVLLSR
jgi:drug/metabolite transporter (DMT)-like permease